MRPVVKILLLAVLSILFGSTKAEAQNISVKTNALLLGALTPNIGFEFVTSGHTSLDVSFCGHVRPYGLTSSMLSIQPEFRYWFNGRPMINEFIGVTTGFTIYDMVMYKQVRNGVAASLGITGGYCLTLSKKWNIEFTGGCSLTYFTQKQYSSESTGDYFVKIPERHNSQGLKFFPIDLGVTFTYIIK